MDIAVGIVDEHAGLHIALGVDVQLVPATGNAATHILDIILEVHGEDSFGIAEFPDAVVNGFSLLTAGNTSICTSDKH